MTILGQDWPISGVIFVPDAEIEPELSVDDLRYEQLIATVAALREALLSMPAPVVNVSEPDLSAVVQAVQDLRPGASADDIGEAIVARLGGQNDPAPSDVLAKLVKSLEKLDFRLKGIGAGPGGGSSYAGSLDVSDRSARQLGVVTLAGAAQTLVVSDDRTLTERMFAKAPSTAKSLLLDTADATYIYIAEAPTADALTAATSQGIRVTKDASGNPLGKVQIATGFAWSSRSAAGWA